MKIKKLTIKNIGSIEKAEIDFERDLNDNFSNTPAPVFLITGDTGSGKSIILDSIAMALYKDTPRLNGVNNSKKNSFTNSTGEAVSINSIEQYTRMGITPKDECYSEVIFEGNDKKTYKARLTLGVNNQKAKKNNDTSTQANEKNIKYRNPVWTLEVENGPSYSGVKDIQLKIQESVGLTFEQFSRMAMLAQGQFAAFLTGDKKERETILEKLTNTEIFSHYGTAIKNLFDCAKTKMSNAKTIYESEKAHTLTAEETEELNRQKEETSKQKEKLNNLNTELEKKIEQLNIIENSNNSLREAQSALAELNEKVDGNEYKNKKALITDWEATTTERQRITDLQQAQTDLRTLEEKALTLQTKYNELVTDFNKRNDKLEHLKAEIEKNEIWLKSKDKQKKLLENAKVYVMQLNDYKNKVNEINNLENEKNVAKDKTEALKNEYDNTDKQLKQAQKNVNDKQKVIELKTESRNKLNPESINAKLSELRNKKSILEMLMNDIKQYNEQNHKRKELDEQINNDKKKIEELKSTLEQKEKAFQEAKTLYQRSNGLFKTMFASIDEKMAALRQQLIDEHATKCPLCGQGIEHDLPSNDEFEELLKPLQEEKERCEKAMNSADTERENAKTECNTLQGNINAKSKQENDMINESQKELNRIKEVCSEMSIDISQGNLANQIENRLDSNKVETTKLENESHKAEVLQKEINTLLQEKKTLEKVQAEANENYQKAKQAVDENNKTIDECEKSQNAAETAKTALAHDISSEMTSTYPDWDKDIDGTKKQLEDHSNEYQEANKRHNQDVTNAQNQTTLIESLRTAKENIDSYMPSWSSSYTTTPYTSQNANSEWNSLLSNVSGYISSKKSLETNISDYRQVLSDYYAKSGNDEAYLKGLIARKSELEEAKAFVKQTNNDITSQNATIQNAQQAIKNAMSKMGVEREEDLWNKNELENQKKEQSQHIDTLNETLGMIKSKFDQDNADKKKLDTAKGDFEKAEKNFEKWEVLNSYFGGTRFRTLVQTYVLRPLLNNANIYLSQITDRYNLTCSEDNEQLSILVYDNYNKQVRSSTLLSGGERFMISLALSLALSSLNRSDMNVDILFIDEGFGTLDTNSIESVMTTLEKLQDIAGMKERRVGIISHRKELERIPVKIEVRKKGEGRSEVVIPKL